MSWQRGFLAGLLVTLMVVTWEGVLQSEQVKLSFIFPSTTIDTTVVDMIAAYEKEFGVEIDIVLNAGWEQHYEKSILMAATGVPFDIVYVDEEHFRTTRAGAFADLTPFMERDRVDRTALHPLALEAFRFQGKYYSMPTAMFTVSMVFHKDLFDKYGLAHPTGEWGSDRWTWDEFIQAGKKLTRDTDGNGKIDHFGYIGLDYRFMPWFWGSDWVNEDVTKSLVDDPITIQAVDRWAELTQVHAIHPAPTISHELRSWSFETGFIGMHDFGSWALPRTRQVAKFNWDVSAFPKGTERHPILYADGLAMGKTSLHKEEVWHFLKYFSTNLQGAINFAMARNAIPALRETYPVWLRRTQVSYPALNLAAIVDGLPYARRVRQYYNANFREIENLIRQQVQTVIDGKKAAAPAMKEIAPLVQQLINEGHI